MSLTKRFLEEVELDNQMPNNIDEFDMEYLLIRFPEEQPDDSKNGDFKTIDDVKE